MIKTINLMRVLSVGLFLIVLALVYAYLPVTVKLTPEDFSYTIHRTSFFYYLSGSFLIINVLFWFVIKLISPIILQNKNEEAAAWFSSIVVVVNFCVMLLLGFIAAINNPAKELTVNYSYLNYIGPILIFIWVIGLIYLLNRKIDSSE